MAARTTFSRSLVKRSTSYIKFNNKENVKEMKNRKKDSIRLVLSETRANFYGSVRLNWCATYKKDMKIRNETLSF